MLNSIQMIIGLGVEASHEETSIFHIDLSGNSLFEKCDLKQYLFRNSRRFSGKRVY